MPAMALNFFFLIVRKKKFLKEIETLGIFASRSQVCESLAFEVRCGTKVYDPLSTT